METLPGYDSWLTRKIDEEIDYENDHIPCSNCPGGKGMDEEGIHFRCPLCEMITDLPTGVFSPEGILQTLVCPTFISDEFGRITRDDWETIAEHLPSGVSDFKFGRFTDPVSIKRETELTGKHHKDFPWGSRLMEEPWWPEIIEPEEA